MKAAQVLHEPLKPGPGRPRRLAAEHAILKATREILAQAGVHGLTVEGVAARSGVAKTTIYRRWRSEEDLALGALLEGIPGEAPAPPLRGHPAAVQWRPRAPVKDRNPRAVRPLLPRLI